MDRLTKKKVYKNHEHCRYFKANKDISGNEITFKLGRLEDIEERLGCPLYVFAKLTLGNKIWVEVEGMKCYKGNHYASVFTIFDVNPENLGETKFGAWFSGYAKDYTEMSEHIELKLNEYGSKWWLRKDKSE